MVNKKTKKRAAQNTANSTDDVESQGAEVVTVAWMISVLSVFVCDLGAAVTRLFASAENPSLGLLSGVLFFAALTIGAVSLLLLPMVLRSRQIPPPRALVIFGALVAVLPWLVLFAKLLGG